MPQAAGLDEKQIALREAHALNPHPQAVADALFTWLRQDSAHSHRG